MSSDDNSFKNATPDSGRTPKRDTSTKHRSDRVAEDNPSFRNIAEVCEIFKFEESTASAMVKRARQLLAEKFPSGELNLKTHTDTEQSKPLLDQLYQEYKDKFGRDDLDDSQINSAITKILQRAGSNTRRNAKRQSQGNQAKSKRSNRSSSPTSTLPGTSPSTDLPSPSVMAGLRPSNASDPFVANPSSQV